MSHCFMSCVQVIVAVGDSVEPLSNSCCCLDLISVFSWRVNISPAVCCKVLFCCICFLSHPSTGQRQRLAHSSPGQRQRLAHSYTLRLARDSDWHTLRLARDSDRHTLHLARDSDCHTLRLARDSDWHTLRLARDTDWLTNMLDSIA